METKWRSWGCNVVGPQNTLATETTAGANPCDRTWIQEAIQRFTAQGYLVIFTFQHMENCSMTPLTAQVGDFIFTADAGAIIVSGSQAHARKQSRFIKQAFYISDWEIYSSIKWIQSHAEKCWMCT